MFQAKAAAVIDYTVVPDLARKSLQRAALSLSGMGIRFGRISIELLSFGKYL